ncbi:MAG TPA: hypothetical protein VKX17_10845 [Planctomycetota bacterium]|nr:hypothetical protein [Planctomycetota bacterium]
MRSNSVRWVITPLAVSAACIFAAGAESDPKDQQAPKPVEPAIVWRQAIVPGPAVTLRMRRPVSKSMIYQGSLDREQKAASSYHETDTFYLNALCASQSDGRDLMALWRSFLDRKRSEVLENGKKIDKQMMNSSELIDLGPNFETVGVETNKLRCYAYDSQNRIAYRTMQMLTLKDGSYVHGHVIKEDDKRITFVTDDQQIDILKEKIAPDGIKDVAMPHVCLDESPHYMFPILPQRPVAPGDTWRFRVPVIIPLEQGLEAKAFPTQFDIVFNGRLREVKETPNGKTAVMDYQIAGVFDSSLPEYRARFPQEFHDAGFIQHRINGDGTAVIDVEHGWMLDRQENFRFFFYMKKALPPEIKYDKKTGNKISEKERKPQETKIEVNSRFDLKLLLPGTRLKGGAIVPGYE